MEALKNGFSLKLKEDRKRTANVKKYDNIPFLHFKAYA